MVIAGDLRPGANRDVQLDHDKDKLSEMSSPLTERSRTGQSEDLTPGSRTMSRILAAAFALLASGAAYAAERPNVVLILADDQGYGDLGCYGAKDLRTPNLDRLAAEGTRFTNFYVAQPVCTASRAALLTGCYPNRVRMAGALNPTSPTGIHPQETLLSELFKKQDYATAIYGKWHLGMHPPFLPTRRGFDEFFGLPYSNDNGPLHPVTKGIPALPLYENERVAATDP